ncbi:MAG: RloB family protein [Aeromonas sp.]
MPKQRIAKEEKPIHSKIYIYCEGSQTERNYLSGYISERYKGNSLIQFVDIPNIKQNTPMSIVTRLINDMQTDAHLPDDIHWAVYDREGVSKISDQEHYEAFQLARKSDIKIAFSNVCIEQWFLYHFLYSQASYTSCLNLLKESELKAKLRERGLLKYDKAEPEIYDYLSGGVENARLNAAKINQEVVNESASGISEEQPYKLNPYTNFYMLLDDIDIFLMEEGFHCELKVFMESALFFPEVVPSHVDLKCANQSSFWNKFKAFYERFFLVKSSNFASIWREKAAAKIEKDYESSITLSELDAIYYDLLYK